MKTMQEVDALVELFQNNPQGLQQRQQLDPNLVNLIAMARIKSQQDANARDVNMSMRAMPTVKENLTNAVLDNEKRNIVQNVSKAKMLEQQRQQQNLQRLAKSNGVAGVSAPNMAPKAMASGGIVSFAKGGDVQGNEDFLYTPQVRLDEIAKLQKIIENANETLGRKAVTQNTKAEAQRAIDRAEARLAELQAMPKADARELDNRDLYERQKAAQTSAMLQNVPFGSAIASLMNMNRENTPATPRQVREANELGAQLKEGYNPQSDSVIDTIPQGQNTKSVPSADGINPPMTTPTNTSASVPTPTQETTSTPTTTQSGTTMEDVAQVAQREGAVANQQMAERMGTGTAPQQPSGVASALASLQAQMGNAPQTRNILDTEATRMQRDQINKRINIDPTTEANKVRGAQYDYLQLSPEQQAMREKGIAELEAIRTKRADPKLQARQQRIARLLGAAGRTGIGSIGAGMAAAGINERRRQEDEYAGMTKSLFDEREKFITQDLDRKKTAVNAGREARQQANTMITSAMTQLGQLAGSEQQAIQNEMARDEARYAEQLNLLTNIFDQEQAKEIVALEKAARLAEKVADAKTRRSGQVTDNSFQAYLKAEENYQTALTALDGAIIEYRSNASLINDPNVEKYIEALEAQKKALATRHQSILKRIDEYENNNSGFSIESIKE